LQLNWGAFVQKLSSAASIVAAAERSELRRIAPSSDGIASGLSRDPYPGSQRQHVIASQRRQRDIGR
jgi:hypothetical protein